MIRLMCLLSLAGSSVSAEVLEFRKVDYFVVVTEDGEEPKEQKFDARLEIDQDAKQLRIVHEKGGAAKATYAEIPFGDVTSVLYERSKSPRVKTAIFLSPLYFWLTIEYKGGYSYAPGQKESAPSAGCVGCGWI